jgi:phage-related baseplate assembly protein
MTTLPEPQFISRDPAVIRSEIIARVEELLGVALPPMSTERAMCEVLAYRETLTRIAVQEACKQNLWAYAQYPMLDHLAAIVNESRIPAKAATATFACTLPSARSVVSVIPAGHQVRSHDGKVLFGLDRDVSIPAGDITGTTRGTCATTGIGGNGYLAGQVAEPLSPLDFQVTISNITTTGGGTASETSDAMRERVPSVLAQLSGAGPGDAYESLARGASVEVVDARATRPSDGVVRVTVLGASGVPSAELLTTVSTALSSETSIPLTDTVEVVAAAPVSVDLVLSVVLYRPQLPRTPQDCLDDVAAVVNTYVRGRGSKLGFQVPDSRVIDTACNVPEVYDADVVGTIPTVTSGQFIRLNSLTVNLAGFTEEPLP